MENDRVLYAAHASHFHWGEIGTSLEFERGEWQISRVYSVLNRFEEAIHHARRCLDICTENGIGDFDIAFAYEALVRAYSSAGDTEKSIEYIRLGEKAGELIEDEGNPIYPDICKRLLSVPSSLGKTIEPDQDIIERLNTDELHVQTDLCTEIATRNQNYFKSTIL